MKHGAAERQTLGRTTSVLNPTFPVVSGAYTLTADWTINLPGEFNLRFEEKDLVIWRPGITLWIAVWGNDEGDTPDQRLSQLVDEIDVGAFHLVTEPDRDIRRFRYRLNEAGADGRVAPFYSFVAGQTGHVQMAIYFNDESDLPLAEQIWRSVRESGAP